MTNNMAHRAIIHFLLYIAYCPYITLVPEIWRELLFLCATGPSSFFKGPGVMLALAFAGARARGRIAI